MFLSSCGKDRVYFIVGLSLFTVTNQLVHFMLYY